MSITFHCEFCGKKIQAKDEAGGKWGKCPSCHNKLYVPAPDAGEELKLAPVDESDEARQKQLMEETYKLTQDILQQRDVPEEPESATPAAAPVSGKSDKKGISDKKLTKNIIIYLQLMANGQLEKAEKVAGTLVGAGNDALEILDTIASDSVSYPQLAEIPHQVLSGLIDTLRNQIR